MSSLPSISHRLFVAALGQPRNESPAQKSKNQPETHGANSVRAVDIPPWIIASKVRPEELYAPGLSPEAR